MSARLALLALGPWLAAAPSASAQVRALASCTPAEVEIGQPVELCLEVLHPPALRARVDPAELELGDAWILLEPGRALTTRSGESAQTRVRWLVAALEPGEHALALPLARYESEGLARTARAEPAQVVVRPALAQGEDAPRPPRGFRPPPELGAPPLSRSAALAGLALFLAGGGALLFVRRRRRRVEPRPPALEPRAALAALAVPAEGEFEAARALHYELARLLRAGVERRSGLVGAGLTDEEWLARFARTSASSPELEAELRDLLASCERVKYGRLAPTRWTSEEMLGRARALLERFESAAVVEEARR